MLAKQAKFPQLFIEKLMHSVSLAYHTKVGHPDLVVHYSQFDCILRTECCCGLIVVSIHGNFQARNENAIVFQTSMPKCRRSTSEIRRM